VVRGPKRSRTTALDVDTSLTILYTMRFCKQLKVVFINRYWKLNLK